MDASQNPPVITYLSAVRQGHARRAAPGEVAPNGDVFVTNRESAVKKSPHNMCYVYNSSGHAALLVRRRRQGHRTVHHRPAWDQPQRRTGRWLSRPTRAASRIEAFTLTQSGGHYSSATWSYTIPSGTGNAAFVGPRGLTTTSDNHLLLADEWGFNFHEFSFTPGTTNYSATYNSTPAAPPVPGVNSPRGVRRCRQRPGLHHRLLESAHRVHERERH